MRNERSLYKFLAEKNYLISNLADITIRTFVGANPIKMPVSSGMNGKLLFELKEPDAWPAMPTANLTPVLMRYRTTAADADRVLRDDDRRRELLAFEFVRGVLDLVQYPVNAFAVVARRDDLFR
ncbi:MAG: hypothetical protein UZ17_ACD001000494 [Acidobacteria bacterium OLB17]|nr:MAG: hypothetical protein UZ17_ACD001000494 [Acidobacteria bacterium OLB17]